MAAEDPFGFGAAAKDGEIDLTAFAPKPRKTNVAAAEVATEVAQSAGFSRRTAPAKTERRPRPEVAKTPKGGKRRVNIQEVLGVEDRYPNTERAQVNMLVPVPVLVRWRELCKSESGPAWAVFERAIEALEGQAKGSRS